MVNDLENAIIKTICYADIFDYPLKISEIRKYLISKNSFSLRQIKKSIETIPFLGKKDNYFFLKTRNDLAITRKSREAESKLKFEKAKKIAAILKQIPTIELIGISGSLAMNNCKKDDDIDFFIITKPHTLWLTRFITTVLLLLFSKKRSTKDIKAKNKICTNMFLTTQSLVLQKKNLFTAHEIVQLKVIFAKNNTYNKFLHANKWALKYLSKGFIIKENKENILQSKSHFLKLLDNLFYNLQLFYMRKKRTTEIISIKVALFHPEDKTSYVLKELEKRYKKQKIKSNVSRSHINTSKISYFSTL